MMNYRQGARGTMVKEIQKVVGAYPDGVWGPLTTEAVKAWQRENGLSADGIVGPATLAKMFPKAVAQALRLRKSKRRIDDIVVHCTATREGQELDVDDIRTMHRANGWSDIGYHYVIGLHGERWEGRDVDLIGAHVSGHNAHSIGVVYVGGMAGPAGAPYSQLKPADTRTEEQKAALMSLLMDLRKLYPKATISGHRDFSPDRNGDGAISPDEWMKACPCFDAKKEYEKI